MLIFSNILQIQNHLTKLKSEGNIIGFVPTMGALHDGHLSLIKKSISENDSTVVSIFVNPTQFDDSNDLLTYPKDIEKDMALKRFFKKNFDVNFINITSLPKKLTLRIFIVHYF